MKTNKLWDTQYAPESVRAAYLARVYERAGFLGMAVCFTTYLVLVLTVVGLASVGWMTADQAFGWGFMGLFLCPFIGAVIGFVYYTITAWRDL